MPIGERPAEAEGRLVPGHREGDLVMGSTASNSAVGTIAERSTGYLTLLPLPRSHHADAVADAIIERRHPHHAHDRGLHCDRRDDGSDRGRIQRAPRQAGSGQ